MLKALKDYYDVLEERGETLPVGFSLVNIHYIISLSPDGRIENIIDCQLEEEIMQKNGKVKIKKVPRAYKFPKRTEKPGIDGNIIEHRPLYIFGLNYEDKIFNPKDRTKKAEKSHREFKEKNLKFLEGLDSLLINAYRNFIENWNPEDEANNKYLLSLGNTYKTAGYAFCREGDINNLLNNDSLVINKWKKMLKESKSDKVYAQDAVSGEISPIARIHPKIKGIIGGQPSGCVLVNFNNESEESYGNKQSYNSNISEEIALKYSDALNYLIRNNRANYIDGMTIISFASNAEKKYEDNIDAFLFPDLGSMDIETFEKILDKLIKGSREGKVTFEKLLNEEDIDPEIDYYIIGIKPNVARISLNFIYRKKYGELLMNIARHQEDMKIDEKMGPIPTWRIEKELISPKSKNEKVSPSLTTKLFQSIIDGTPYPEQLAKQMIRRIKIDREIGMTSEKVRMGLIKAWLNRKARFNNKKEEIFMALDVSNKNQGYLLGRLFAVLEQLQQSASNSKLNHTIRDGYFAAASTKPASVFPKLIKLSQNHLKKTKYPGYYNKLIGEIIDMMEYSFPDFLSLKDQGSFIIGYYQQIEALFSGSKSVKEERNAQ